VTHHTLDTSFRAVVLSCFCPPSIFRNWYTLKIISRPWLRTSFRPPTFEPLGPLSIVSHANYLMFSERHCVRVTCDTSSAARLNLSHSRIFTPRYWYCATNAFLVRPHKLYCVIAFESNALVNMWASLAVSSLSFDHHLSACLCPRTSASPSVSARLWPVPFDGIFWTRVKVTTTSRYFIPLHFCFFMFYMFLSFVSAVSPTPWK
jgi:hypothetical protein